MEITKTALKKMDAFISGEPPETGGILGSQNGSCITDIIMDKPEKSVHMYCRYEPNVSFLNNAISDWADAGILFKGIFHTHFMDVKSLSEADKNYICEIMRCMPQEVDYLYFPIFVLPSRELICYRASKNNTKIIIADEELILS